MDKHGWQKCKEVHGYGLRCVGCFALANCFPSKSVKEKESP